MVKLIIYAIIAIVLIGLIVVGVGGYFLFDLFSQGDNANLIQSFTNLFLN